MGCGFRPAASQKKLFHALTYTPGVSKGDHGNVTSVKVPGKIISKASLAKVPVLGRGLEVKSSNIPEAGRGYLLVFVLNLMTS